ncbi:MAG: GTPase Era [Deltaproteobacteria bacterium]
MEEQTKRCGFVALAGAPNVGKSTLLNRIIGAHLSIATAKAQTTRTRILGITTRGPVQLAFTDTPGIHHLGSRGNLLQKRMVSAARSGVHSADVTCWIVDAAHGMGRIDREELPKLDADSTLVALNKIDLVDKDSLLPLMAEVGGLLPKANCIPVSASTGENLDLLLEHLSAAVPAGPWMFPDDQLTDQSERNLVAELIREQLFRQLDQELPYRVAVRVEEYDDQGRKVHVEAIIYTDSTSSKKMIVGKDGSRIKKVGTAARRAAEDLIGKGLYLDLRVKVKKDWQQNSRFLEELGL